MIKWRLNPDFSHLAHDFSDLDAVFALQGERITFDPISSVIRVIRGGQTFYVKRYHTAGKGLRPFLPHPRIKLEWQNLQHFRRWGIPTAQVVAYGMQRRNKAFVRGAMITLEIPNSRDLADLAHKQSPLLKDRHWVQQVSAQLAIITRTLHAYNFTHNDLKWRNVLVDDQNKVFLIDCPTGRFWHGPFLRYRIIKDLACLDKVAKYHLSRTQRLRFYLDYCQRTKLIPADKAQIKKIIRFFAGRE